MGSSIHHRQGPFKLGYFIDCCENIQAFQVLSRTSRPSILSGLVLLSMMTMWRIMSRGRLIVTAARNWSTTFQVLTRTLDNDAESSVMFPSPLSTGSELILTVYNAPETLVDVVTSQCDGRLRHMWFRESEVSKQLFDFIKLFNGLVSQTRKKDVK